MEMADGTSILEKRNDQDLTFFMSWVEYIDLSIIKTLKLEAELLGEWTKLAEKLANVFSHVEYLGASFIQVSWLLQVCMFKLSVVRVQAC